MSKIHSFDELQDAHPLYTNALKTLLLHDQRVEDYLISMYGVDTLENLQATSKYHNYIDTNKDDGSILSKFARKRNLLMELYIRHFSPLISVYGYATAVNHDKMATAYLKTILKLD